uniref:Uncharacterized protein LOC100184814 n=1 Tax=Phallusia mammillata TaxID=59560 RepID=A0A6F9DIV5_9ASCI|nr:uncharacterized protein LOC100184814 [Phallusia mammillata]
MLLPKQIAASYHYYLLVLLRRAVGCVRFLPAFLSGWFLIGLRLLFFSLLGFAAWVRNFSDNLFACWFLLALGVCFLLQKSICGRECTLQERCDECSGSEILRKEIETQRLICRTLDHVKAALETKSLIEYQAKSLIECEKSEENATNLLAKYEDKSESPTEKHLMSKKDRGIIDEGLAEHELIAQYNQEIEKIRIDYASHLGRLQSKSTEARCLASNKTHLEALLSSAQENVAILEKENGMLKATIEIMIKQRKEMIEKHTASVKRVKQLSSENDSLSSKLLLQEQSRGDELRKDGELKKEFLI